MIAAAADVYEAHARIVLNSKSATTMAIEPRDIVMAAPETRASSGPAFLSAGQSLDEHHIRVVDPKTGTCLKPGQIGEIWAAGDGTGSGCLSFDTAATARHGKDPSRYQRTGYLGAMLAGRLFPIAHADDTITINGIRRNALDFVEAVEKAEPKLGTNRTIAFRSEPSGDGIVVLHEIDGVAGADGEMLRRIVRGVVESFQATVETALIVPTGTLLRDDSGTIDFLRSRLLYLAGGLREYQSQSISWAGEDRIQPADRNRLPLSRSEQRVLATRIIAGDDSALNLVAMVRMNGPIDSDALAKTFVWLSKRHQILRTRYLVDEDTGTSYAVVDPVPDEVLIIAAKANSFDAAIGIARDVMTQPFDLANALHFKAFYIPTGHNEALLGVRVHHVAGDAASTAILWRDIAAAYRAFAAGRTPDLAPPALQYRDHAIRERETWSQERQNTLEDFWRRTLAGAPVCLNLPFDRPRPSAMTTSAGRLVCHLNAGFGDTLRETARRYGCSFFKLAVTAFSVLCCQLSNAREAVIGTAVSTRHSQALEDTFGLFVNTVPIRLKVEPEGPFSEHTAAARKTINTLLQFADLPFDDLVRAIDPPRSNAHDPIFQVFFQLRQTESHVHFTDQLEGELLETETEARGADLSVVLNESSTALTLDIGYSADLFEPESIEIIRALYLRLLSAIAEHSDCSIGALWQTTLSTPAEARHGLPIVSPEAIDALLDRQDVDTGAWYRLSPAQRDLWMAEQSAPAGTLFSALCVLDCPPQTDPEQLAIAMTHVSRGEPEFACLRFSDNGLQCLTSAPVPDTPLIHIDRLDDSPEGPAAIVDWHRSLGGSKTGFAVFASPERVVAAVSASHLVCDGFGAFKQLQLLADVFNAQCKGCKKEIRFNGPFLPTLAEADLYLWSKDAETDRDFWRTELTGTDAPPLVTALADRPYATDEAPFVRSHRIKLPKPLQDDLLAVMATEKMSAAPLLTGLIAIYLGRCTDTMRPILSVPYLNRNETTLSVPGHFANTVPLIAAFDPTATVRKALHQLGMKLRTTLHHARLSIGEINRLSGFDPRHGDTSVNVLFAFDTPQIGGKNAAIRWLSGPESGISFMFTRFGRTQPIELEIRYNAHLFDPDTIERHAERVTGFIGRAINAFDKPVKMIPLLEDSEHRRLLNVFNDTDRAQNEEETILDLIDRMVARYPNNTAVSDGARSLTYRALSAAANRLARLLRQKGIDRNRCVGVLLSRCVEQAVVTLAIWRAGGTYVPLEPDYPAQRLTDMLRDAAVSVLIASKEAPAAITSEFEHFGQAVFVDEPKTASLIWGFDPEHEDYALDRDQVPAAATAYIIFTSGSTGRPKGVTITHCAFASYQRAISAYKWIGPGDVCVSQYSPSFDASIGAMIFPWVHGATLFLVPDPWGGDYFEYIASAWTTERKVFDYTPAMLGFALEDECFRTLENLTVIVGGEALPADLTNRCLSLGMRLINSYGPTESTVGITVWGAKPGFERVLIGKPIANTRAYVVDSQMNPVPIGLPGELLIGGAQLASGYLNRPELTAEQFIENPFSIEPSGRSKERLYRTGDLARWTGDGELEYLGRIDSQVKIRGMRVELGEIEAQLMALPEIKTAVADALPSGTCDVGHTRLVAYLVAAADEGDANVGAGEPTDGTPVDAMPRKLPARLSTNDLRSRLEPVLPKHMLPTAFLFVDRIPLTISGKIDFAALRMLPLEGMENTDFEAPEDDTEKQIAALFSEILDISNVGREDDFFALGGHSLSAMRLIALLDSKLKTRLSIRSLFEAPTVAGLAAAVKNSSQADRTTTYDPLIRLTQARPTETPSRPILVCFHGSTGLASIFAQPSFLDPLRDRVDVIAVQARGIFDDRQPFEDYRDMITCYSDALQTAITDRPCVLLGWSLGGHLAFDVACKLARAGNSPEALILLDSDQRSVARQTLDDLLATQPSASPLDAAMAAVVQHVFPAIREQFAQATSRAEQLRLIADAAVRNGQLPGALESGDEALINRLVAATYGLLNLLAARQNTTECFAGRVLCVRAADTAQSGAEPALGWSAHCATVDLIDAPFDHFDFFVPEAAAWIGQKVRSWIEELPDNSIHTASLLSA